MDKSSEAFRTITEVAETLDLPQHVLRFWEHEEPADVVTRVLTLIAGSRAGEDIGAQ